MNFRNFFCRFNKTRQSTQNFVVISIGVHAEEANPPRSLLPLSNASPILNPWPIHSTVLSAFPQVCWTARFLKLQAMEDPHSVSSPRRIHSLSKKRRATVSSLDADEKAPGFGVSGKHGPKPSEVYGFVGSITTVVATVIFLAWAYVPEAWLHYIGIFYYPSRYWALAGPVYVMMTIVLALGFYVGLNFMSTPYPTSLNTMFDEFSREPSSFIPSMDGDDRPIEPIFDIGINKINDLMFNNVN